MMPQRSADDDRDEDPTDEDIERFSAPVVGRCPECGHHVIEDADICPKCHSFLWDGPQANKKSKMQSMRGIFILLTIVLILTLSGLMAVLLRR
jgi:predicted nucleic acid-binding Zn ribbon protein